MGVKKPSGFDGFFIVGKLSPKMCSSLFNTFYLLSPSFSTILPFIFKDLGDSPALE
jgi:hypothetical protein